MSLISAIVTPPNLHSAHGEDNVGIEELLLDVLGLELLRREVQILTTGGYFDKLTLCEGRHEVDVFLGRLFTVEIGHIFVRFGRYPGGVRAVGHFTCRPRQGVIDRHGRLRGWHDSVG